MEKNKSLYKAKEKKGGKAYQNRKNTRLLQNNNRKRGKQSEARERATNNA